jgi:hypothetical protein
MDGKIEQCVSIKFCKKLGKSTTETLEILREASGEHSLPWTVVFEWHSHFKAGPVSVESDESSRRPSTGKTTENFEKKKFKNSFTKTIAEQSVRWHTPLGSVMAKKDRRQCLTSRGNHKRFSTALRKIISTVLLKLGKQWGRCIPKETILKEMAAKID